jgi:hypothetical protein
MSGVPAVSTAPMGLCSFRRDGRSIHWSITSSKRSFRPVTRVTMTLTARASWERDDTKSRRTTECAAVRPQRICDPSMGGQTSISSRRPLSPE